MILVRLDLQVLREVTGCLLVLGLLFIEESCEGNNVCIDLLVADSAAAIVVRHLRY